MPALTDRHQENTKGDKSGSFLSYLQNSSNAENHVAAEKNTIVALPKCNPAQNSMIVPQFLMEVTVTGKPEGFAVETIEVIDTGPQSASSSHSTFITAFIFPLVLGSRAPA